MAGPSAPAYSSSTPASSSPATARIAYLSNQEIERWLEEAPQDLSIKYLAAVAWIASDKIAKYERWG